MQLITPQNWTDYELIDSGGFEKLERFGQYVLARPEPQAVWDKALPTAEWDKAHATFRKEKNAKGDSERGEWVLKPGMPDRWPVHYQHQGLSIKMRLALTAFKHVGIFPEQADNWNFIYDTLQQIPIKQPRVLNLFAYTGGASLAAKAAGADVVHVDSVKQVINWSRDNMELSGLTDIRWVVEDAMKFVRREVKRGNKYTGIILDPPAYGRGPDGEKWVLEENINELMKLCHELLLPEQNFFILNLYSMGFSALIAESLVKHTFGEQPQQQIGELYLQDKSSYRLPLGIFLRFRNV